MNKRLLGIFAKYGVPFKDATKQLGSALAEGLREAAGEVEQAARKVRDEIMKHLSNIQVRVNVDVVVPDTSDRDEPGKRQHGGRVRKGFPYVVGEAGMELFVPTQSGSVLTNNALVAAGSGGGGGGGAMQVLHFHFDNLIAGDARSIADEITAMVAPRIGRFAMYESRV